MLWHIVIGLLAFVLAFASDYLETRYVRAVHAWEEARKKAEPSSTASRYAHKAAHSSIGMWLVGCVGLVLVVEVGWWALLPEGLGLYAGTLVSMRNKAEKDDVTRHADDVVAKHPRIM